jgi:hypothetical protein
LRTVILDCSGKPAVILETRELKAATVEQAMGVCPPAINVDRLGGNSRNAAMRLRIGNSSWKTLRKMSAGTVHPLQLLP